MKKVSTKMKITFVIVAIVVLCFSAYEFMQRPTSEERFFQNSLNEFIKSERNKVLLKDLTNFKWDHVCLVEPYGGISDSNFRNFELNKKLPSDDEGKISMVFFETNIEKGRVLVLDRNYYFVESTPNSKLCKSKGESSLEKINNKIFF